MKGAFGALRWAPDTFWRSTLTEFIAAIDGYSEAKGGEKKPEAPSDEEMLELLAKYG